MVPLDRCSSDFFRVILIPFQTKCSIEMGLNADINPVVGCYLCLKLIDINPCCAELLLPSIVYFCYICKVTSH